MTNVVPFDSKKRLEVSLQPADFSVAQAAVAALVKGTQIPPSIEDLPAYKKTMAEFLARYPADVLLEAVNEAIPNHKWLPGTNEMIELCEKLIAPRRAELDALKWAEDYERRAAAECAAKQAEREQLQAESGARCASQAGAARSPRQTAALHRRPGPATVWGCRAIAGGCRACR